MTGSGLVDSMSCAFRVSIVCWQERTLRIIFRASRILVETVIQNTTQEDNNDDDHNIMLQAAQPQTSGQMYW